MPTIQTIKLRDRNMGRLIAIKHPNGRCYEIEENSEGYNVLSRISNDCFDQLAETFSIQLQ